jgi:hypothetical protein
VVILNDETSASEDSSMLRKRLPFVLIVIAAFVCGFLAGDYNARPLATSYEPGEFKNYCLLTWNGRSDDLCFGLMQRYKRNEFIKGWFSKWRGKCGVSELKHELSTLPQNTYIEWNNWPPRFTYPQQNVADELVEFAKTKGLRLELNPAFDQPVFSEEGHKKGR